MWNTEIPWLLATGGDDSKQVLWDIRNKQVIFCAQQPTLAMTSFTSHPDRPFSYISSHFDASMIHWAIDCLPDIAITQLKFLLGCPKIELVCDDVHSSMTGDHKAKLAGEKSAQLL